MVYPGIAICRDTNIARIWNCNILGEWLIIKNKGKGYVAIGASPPGGNGFGGGGFGFDCVVKCHISLLVVAFLLLKVDKIALIRQYK